MINLNPGVNIDEVKKYNASLKQYQDKASQVKAGIDFNKKELERLCSELSKELGITVTPENVMQIREERIAKIENTLKVGNEILSRIKSEEEIANGTAVPSTPAGPTATGIGMNIPSAPQFNTPVTPVAPAAPAAAPAAPKAPSAPDGLFSDLSGIPPIFSNGI